MWRNGNDHKQRDRTIDNKLASSEQKADMYIHHKDHKEKRSTRPVVTGYNWNTLGFLNSESDLLESANKAKEGAYGGLGNEEWASKRRNRGRAE